MKFNERLLELRKKNGLSQEELGYKIDVSRQTISKWESGQTTPDLEKLRLLAKFFEISVDELIKDDDEENEKEIIEKNEIKKKSIKKKVALEIFIVIILLYISITIYRLIALHNVEMSMYWLVQIATYNNSYIEEKNTFNGSEIKHYQFYSDDYMTKIKKTVYPDEYLASDPVQEEYIFEYAIDAGQDKYNYEYVNINETNKTYTYNKLENVPQTDMYSIGNTIHNNIIDEYKSFFNTTQYLKNKLLIALDFRINIGKTKEGYFVSNYKTKEPKNEDSCSVSIDLNEGKVIFEVIKHDKETKSKFNTIKYVVKTNNTLEFKGIIPANVEIESPTKIEDVELPDLSEYTLIN